MLKEGDVAVRRHSCWCLSCLQSAIRGPALGLSSSYQVKDCTHALKDPGLYEYHNRSCRVADGAGVGDPDERARSRGKELAAQLNPNGGEWVLVEAFDEDEDGDVMWLGKTVRVDRLDGSCCMQIGKQVTLHDDESRSTVFSKGDHAIAIDWFERVSDDPERRTFVRGDGVVCFTNSTELRLIVDPLSITPSSQGSARRWKLQREAEQNGEDYCR